MNLTIPQAALLNFIATSEFPPTRREMCDYFGWAAGSSRARALR